MASPPSSTTALVGPPEIRHLVSANPAVAVLSATAAADVPASSAETPNAFPDILDKHLRRVWQMGLTENFSPTFLSSGNPCLDFFFKVVPDTTPEEVASLLAAAWAHDAITALRLVCNLRGVRGTGKCDREGFYAAALWLHAHHPRTLALNVPHIAAFGYLKDLPEILHRLLLGADVRKKAAEGRNTRPRFVRVGCYWRRPRGCHRVKRKDKVGTREERLARELSRVQTDAATAGERRRQRRAELAFAAVRRYNEDPSFRQLHDRVADYFAAELLADLDHLRSGRPERIGLASKWCPSIDSSFDRSTLLCEAVARRVFPRDAAVYAGVEDPHYAYRVRDRLRKEVLVPLRRALELPEVYMSAGEWLTLPYPRVASVAMKNYKKHFRKHDGARFSEYLASVERGEAKLAAGALLPHELVVVAIAGEDKVAELQWRRMVEDLQAKGSLRNCLAVCDVSGSMSGTPMDVAVALGILTSELSEAPWKGKVVTFSERPEIHAVEGQSLGEKARFVKEMEWGSNTDFRLVFERILEAAVEAGVPPDGMVRRVFVFSDMEFDEARSVAWESEGTPERAWETDYETVSRGFGEKGYRVPEMVFWNLRNSRSTPVTAEQVGVALVSGFSKNLMTMFLERDGVLGPETVLEAALAGEEYRKLAVYD